MRIFNQDLECSIAQTTLMKVKNDLIVFDINDNHILLQRMEDLIGIKETALSLFKFYSSHRFPLVHVNDRSSMHAKVRHGVPQGSVLGPILFTLYVLLLGNFIRKHSINFHHADTQINKLNFKHALRLASRMDYCNSLLSDCPNKSLKTLQLI